MVRPIATSMNLPETPLGGNGVAYTPQNPSAAQTAFNWAKQKQLSTDQAALRALFGAAVRAAGGIDWLCAALDKQPSYATKIGEAINGVADRKIQLEWFGPLLEDSRAGELILGWLSERWKYEPPVKARVVDESEDARICRSILETLPEPQRSAFRQERARLLGVKPEDL